MQYSARSPRSSGRANAGIAGFCLSRERGRPRLPMGGFGDIASARGTTKSSRVAGYRTIAVLSSPFASDERKIVADGASCGDEKRDASRHQL
jgi:hypothetical protein